LAVHRAAKTYLVVCLIAKSVLAWQICGGSLATD
jgi:hypothetical protein